MIFCFSFLVSWWYISPSPLFAFWTSSSAFEIPSLTGTWITFFASNLCISTFLSAATIIQVQWSISSCVNWFLTPSCPLVSTLIEIFNFSPACSKALAAIKVWAIPVGHAVTAKTAGWTISFTSSFLFSLASINCKNSSLEDALIKAFLKSSSINKVDNCARACKWAPPESLGAPIIKNK